MHQRKSTKSSGEEIESWELALVSTTARRIRTTERDELEADLAQHLLRLKRRPPKGIRDWKAFLTTALRNKAANWIRNQQTREERLARLHEPSQGDSERTFTLEDVLISPEPDHDRRLALARVLEELDTELKIMWELLLEEKGNQAKVARRSGKHRNTVRLWALRIKQVLKRHGF
jgi:DNA-directed RNA polymerase specialized sigma24 family protein